MTLTFTAAEVEYLRRQHLGRLATVDPSGAPQNNPVGFFVDQDTGHVTIGGLNMGRSRKFRNVQQNPTAALVVDDLVSTNPWTVRGIEIRGTAEALEGVEPPSHGYSGEVIRITPTWIGSWGIEGDAQGLQSRSEARQSAS